MIKSNILKVLDQLIRDAYFHCDWAIEWQEQRNVIELIFQVKLDNHNQRHFWRADHSYSNDELILFIMSVLIYDSNSYEMSGTHHTMLIPVDFQKGLEYGECLALVKYLKILTSTIPVKWEEFLTSSQTNAFSVEWDWDEYNKVKERLIGSHRYSHTLIYFPN